MEKEKLMEKDAKIYVAGHTGMVGAAICRALVKAGYNNLIKRSHKELDLTCQKDVAVFFKEEKPDYVFLAAARVGGILANSTYPGEFIYQNLLIQSNIIHSAHIVGVKKLLFLGSSCIYPRNCPQPMGEEYLLTGSLESTNEAYAIAKIAGIKMCQSYFIQYNDNFISVMPTNLYGPYDNFDLESSHVLPAMIRRFHQAKVKWNKEKRTERKKIAVELWGTGQAYREFLHVEDMADACLFVMKNIEAKKLYGRGLTHLNIGSGKEILISELAQLIKEIVGFNGTIKYDTTKPTGTPRKLLDVRRMTDFGWRYQISLKRGIKQTYDWYLKAGKS
jgi:GDP-L-fucose synthase